MWHCVSVSSQGLRTVHLAWRLQFHMVVVVVVVVVVGGVI
jgi:hypothetical protein